VTELFQRSGRDYVFNRGWRWARRERARFTRNERLALD